MVNELTYKIDEQSVGKFHERANKNVEFSDDTGLLSGLGDHFDFTRQEMKKIRSQLSQVELEVRELREELKNARTMIK